MSGLDPNVIISDASGTQQGTSGAPLRVDPTGTTSQPITGTVAVTLSTKGQATMANSLPVVIASDQTSIAVTAAQATGTNLHAVIDSGSTTAVTQATAANLNATVVQSTAANFNATVVGAGTAGTPSGGVVSIQGVASGTVVPVSGTVTAAQATAANLNATVVQSTAANLNATVVQTTGSNLHVAVDSATIAALTDGTQKAIVRGGAKGTTTAADVTSTAEGANNNALDVQIYHGGTAINPTSIRALTSSDVVTAAQATAANLNATVVQATGSNLHVVLDTTSTTAVTQATAANLNATVIGTGTAGTPSAGIMTVQGNVSGTPIPVSGTLVANSATSATSAPTSVAGSASSVTVLAANANRLGAAIVNDSTAVLYLKLGAGPATNANYTVRMGVNAYYEVPFRYTGIITGIWASAAGNARVTEFTA